MIKLTFISDTHNKHNQIKNSLIGGDFLIHAGDFSSMGHAHEIENFCKWFDKIDNYTHKIFIAGNHDLGFENYYEQSIEIVNQYPNIIYLQDKSFEIDDIKIYGSPWQPWFLNWAFNLPRNGEELENKWKLIPDDTDILITHAPVFGTLDTVVGRKEHLGCSKLCNRIKEIMPKIHVCGHIHTGYGYIRDEDTHFFNASVLDESYIYTQKPFNIEWDKETNEIKIIEY
jgi:Icc-related predicted phosphoesterase